MSSSEKPLPAPPRPSRPLYPWGRSNSMCSQHSYTSRAPWPNTDNDLQEIHALKKENEQLRGLIALLTEEKKQLQHDLAENKRLRAITDEYRKTLSNLMSYTVIAVTECKERSRQTAGVGVDGGDATTEGMGEAGKDEDYQQRFAGYCV